MRYSKKWLVELQEANREQRLKFLCFWGHQPSKDGTINASCFSQWWEGHPFTATDSPHVFLSTEHWMMAQKALLFEDEDCFNKIMAAKSPAEAKKLGREVQKFNQELWEEHRMDIVVKGNYYKFSQHPELKEFILSTTSRILVEASPVDAIWGIGHAANHPDAERPENWRGENLLGFALMEVRDELSTLK